MSGGSESILAGILAVLIRPLQVVLALVMRPSMDLSRKGRGYLITVLICAVHCVI